MSGPKTSQYTLTFVQRRILAEQRELMRRRAVASETIKRTQKRLHQIGGMFTAEKQIAAELVARTGSDNGLSALIGELDALIAPVQPLISRTDYHDVDSVEKTASEVSSRLAQAREIAQKITAIASANESSLKTNLWEALEQGFSTSFADIKEVDGTSTSSLREDAARKLAQLRRTAILPPSCRDEILEVSERLDEITNEVFLKNFIAVSVNPLIKKANQLIAEYAECQTDFETLYAEYIALCDLYSYVAQKYVCSRASIQALRSEIQRIKDAAAADDEQAYISASVDEVMSEMGYSVLGSREVTKRNGKRFRNELYAYGDGTAVNITYSSDGRIAMELGGLDTSDRVPTAQETDLLCDSMEKFCDDFKEIEKRLVAKGVIPANRISLLPPDPEYAQIINTADYSMQTEAEAFQVNKRRGSASRPKVMQKE